VSEEFEGAARTLEEAHHLFDWRNWERMEPDQLGRYYEKRTNHEHLRRLLPSLRGAVRNSKWLHALYMGPPGCGKSTDLTWWVQQVQTEPALEEPLLILHFEVGEAVGTHDVGFAEIALAMVLEIYERFERLHVGRVYKACCLLHSNSPVSSRSMWGKHGCSAFVTWNFACVVGRRTRDCGRFSSSTSGS